MISPVQWIGLSLSLGQINGISVAVYHGRLRHGITLFVDGLFNVSS